MEQETNDVVMRKKREGTKLDENESERKEHRKKNRTIGRKKQKSGRSCQTANKRSDIWFNVFDSHLTHFTF
jgi:hypothetical protein